LQIAHSSFYYQALPPSDEELLITRLLDKQYLETPFYGSRKMTLFIRSHGYVINRKRVQRLMRQMGLFGIYPKPNTSKAHPAHGVYPYLLRELAVTRANQVWCSDITYIPGAKGHFYLVAIMDWYSRKVLAWRISNTLDVPSALRRSVKRYRAIALQRFSTSIKGRSLRPSF
jgi:putative transposase